MDNPQANMTHEQRLQFWAAEQETARKRVAFHEQGEEKAREQGMGLLASAAAEQARYWRGRYMSATRAVVKISKEKRK